MFLKCLGNVKEMLKIKFSYIYYIVIPVPMSRQNKKITHRLLKSNYFTPKSKCATINKEK